MVRKLENPKCEFVDTHAHLHMRQFDQDREDVIANFERDHIRFVVEVGVDIESSLRVLKLSEKNERIFSAVGVHPHDVKILKDEDLEKLEELLEERIEDRAGNTTRFLVIGRKKHEPTGKDKTSFMFSVAHEPGSLVRVLNVLADHHINMTKLESRPYPGRRWEYVFFVDVEGHIDEDRLKTAFDEMKKYCLSMKFLGSYPKSAVMR